MRNIVLVVERFSEIVAADAEICGFEPVHVDSRSVSRNTQSY
jgi:hypothetical protein